MGGKSEPSNTIGQECFIESKTGLQTDCIQCSSESRFTVLIVLYDE